MAKWRLEEAKFDEEGKKVLYTRGYPGEKLRNRNLYEPRMHHPGNKSRKLLFNQNTHCGLLNEEGKKSTIIFEMLHVFSKPLRLF